MIVNWSQFTLRRTWCT